MVLAFPKAPLTPKEDPFYIAPDNLENYKLGDIIRSRNTPTKVRSIFVPLNLKYSWQLLVRSEDSFGNPNAFVTTIMEPYNADPKKIVSYQTFEDSADLNCSPSYGFLFGASIATIATQIEMTSITLALQKGYYVVSPDYEGYKSAFAAGRQAGYATLNSIRAILNTKKLTGIDPDAKVALLGYSGGSIASSWANVLLNSYAPEIEENIIGTVLGGFVTNIKSIAESVDGGLVAGLIPVALTGLGNEYPEFKSAIEKEIDHDKDIYLKYAGQVGLAGAVLKYFGHRFLSGKNPLIPRGLDVLNEPTIDRILKENSLLYLDTSKFKPTTPIFIYHGKLDHIVPIKDVKKIYQLWSDAGVPSLEFAEDLLNGHITEAVIGAPAAWTWIENRFNGIPPIKGCSHTSRAENILYPNVSKATFEYFKGLIKAITFAKIGYRGLSTDNISISAFKELLGKLESYFSKDQ
ncbi:hypothetical protein KGF54_000599 [Candida jiufengensis]|uniref:uncharacterized protein n=1 Tax=Candida jiufengensis TaxID=497108 RepID=UPI0022250776|nr:uncharacterized protein KGF54_000599 [Candida jiufengensis]KAI5956980.1 hypothetical protein KGF54_000599 [Candida jiufengensis]